MLVKLASYLSRVFGLSVLPNHIHTIALSVALFHVSYILGGYLSNIICPKTYNALSPKNKIVWRVKVVSFVHAVSMCYLSCPILNDPVLKADKLFSYTPYSGTVYAITCGYFVWDIIYVIIQGQHISFLFHGIACLIVFLFSFTPIFNYYGAVFLMFELSTPFLNIGYFMDKCGLTGTFWAKLNAVVLLLTFFGVRLVFGIYMSYYTLASAFERLDRIPTHLIAIYFSANILLNVLNLLWFVKLTTMVIKQLQVPPPTTTTSGKVAAKVN